MADCVPCNTAPPPCDCSPSQTCVQTPRNCSTCPRNICISDPSSQQQNSNNSSSLGPPIGGAIGGLAAAILIILVFWFLYRRNLLPSFCTAIFESSSTKSFSKKHPHHLKNQKNLKSSSSHHLNSQNEPHHQSVVYLPTDTRDPNSASTIESDADDPFSDKHSGVSIIPKGHYSNPATMELLASHAHPNPPTAHLPSLPRTPSIIRFEDKDAPIESNTAEQNNPTTPTPLAPHPNQRSSFTLPTLPTLPSPSHSTTTQHKPVRPHRAPDLDLRLPGATASTPLADPEALSSSQTPKPNSADPLDRGSSSLLPSLSEDNSHSSRRHSSSSDATTHDSHLSSILDPAMIVTPITLVRTASGRQAAVQRVALRGQEKARVVRLPPSSNPHGPSPLSISTDTREAGRSNKANVRETFGFSPLTPGVGRADNIGTNQSLSADLSAIDVNDLTEDVGSRVERVGDDDDNDEVGQLPNAHARPSPSLSRSRSAAAYSIASSSFGSSSVCDSYIEDEEVEFPTVLGRSAATLAQRILQRQHDQQQQQQKPGQQQQFNQQQQQQHGQQQNMEGPTTTTSTHHHVNLKALGRDRAISLSSIITEEAGRDSLQSPSSPPPPIPSMAKGNALPTPFKPFAGQKPSRASGRTEGGESSSTESHARLSSASSLRSGYGSVLEGIPFNIGFSSHPDDLFLRPSSLDSPSDPVLPSIDDDDDLLHPPATPTLVSPAISVSDPTTPRPHPLPPAPPRSSSRSSCNLVIDSETRAALDYINQL
ncbi:hypothetical protein VP01_1915g3 [Puccinia sorghi]|uniref:Membrane anchor Opy2 N-terminal domain-containing protein n=1 Tax=Puccinia sorghi TaxID=27349 RepID=A0A0L6VCL3_9BASI|nr:hypothetical protein VP01_1915g3 [Puccinia sorghi]